MNESILKKLKISKGALKHDFQIVGAVLPAAKRFLNFSIFCIVKNPYYDIHVYHGGEKYARY